MTEVTMKMKQFEGSSPGTSNVVTQIAISQATNANLGRTSENRYLDWQEYSQEDHIFGKTVVQSRFIGNSSQAAKPVPCAETRAAINDPEVVKFLRAEIDENCTPCSGFLVEKAEATVPLEGGEEGLWIHVVIRSQEPKWIAEQASDTELRCQNLCPTVCEVIDPNYHAQVWGFEIIDRERRYVRRTLMSVTNGNYRMGRLVYRFVDQKCD